MNDDQITKLFRYIEEFRADITEKVKAKASQSSVNQFIGNTDAISGDVELAAHGRAN